MCPGISLRLATPLDNIEYWMESDSEINEDVNIREIDRVPSPDVPLNDKSSYTESADTTRITRWIITLLAIFQSRFFLIIVL